MIDKAKFRIPLRIVAAALVGALTLLLGYACASSRSVTREIETTPRDPQTGIVLGTEAVSLGGGDASIACLMLHGFVGSRIDFAGLGERLAEKGFYVRMTRLPGHGTTPIDFSKQSADDLYAATVAEYATLRSRFDTIYVVGFSMGGALATLLAAEYPVDRLVLVAPYFKVTYYWYYVLPPAVWNRLLSPVVHYVPKTESFIRVNKRESVEHMYSYRNVPTQGAATLEQLGKRARQPETLAKVTSPVLVLHAYGDEAASPAAMVQAFERLGSQSKRIRWFSEKINHHILWDYEGEEAADEIVDYLMEGARQSGLTRP